MGKIKEFKIEEYLTTEAMLEQTAEEASELAHAASKLARKLRGENPTPKTEQECITALNEEIADVMLCLSVLIESYGITTHEDVESVYMIKQNRLESRLKESRGEI